MQPFGPKKTSRKTGDDAKKKFGSTTGALKTTESKTVITRPGAKTMFGSRTGKKTGGDITGTKNTISGLGDVTLFTKSKAPEPKKAA